MLRILVFLITVTYWLTLFLLTHLPPVKVPVARVNDKLAHVIAYFLLTLLLLLSNQIRRKPFPLWSILSVVLLYGILDEQTQKFVGRICSLADWIADAAGAVLALLLMLTLRSRITMTFPKPSELS